MPHSGGRVGRGMYFASEHSKSAGYVGPASFKGKRVVIMFLAEVALGAEHTITQDDSSLTCAPKGTDCVVARGHVEPDPNLDTHLTFDGKDVAVPQGALIPQPQYTGSSFSQSEYLIYKESQHRIRYAIKFKWGY
jgi:poly [ADP-ribose] polymerase